MTRRFGDQLTVLEQELARPEPAVGKLLQAARDLAVPPAVKTHELKRFFAACVGLLKVQAGDASQYRPDTEANRNLRLLRVVAGELIDRTLYDSETETREFITHQQEWHRAKEKPIPHGLDDSQLPPRLEIPLEEDMADECLKPYLEFLEHGLDQVQTGHFKLCWKVERQGYPVFQRVFRHWLIDLEARGIGMPGTAEAVAKASSFHELTEALRDAPDSDPEISSATLERRWMPLLDHPHPMVAAGAGRYLGALYANAAFRRDMSAPTLRSMLDKLRNLTRHRAAVSGAFIDGYDVLMLGLSALTTAKELKDAEFDLNGWVLEVLAGDKETYLPNAQAFWFPVHEYYFNDPEFVGRLIELDHDWVALMCATEAREPVSGMRPMLDRLATSADPEIAAAAQSHRDRFYF